MAGETLQHYLEIELGAPVRVEFPREYDEGDCIEPTKELLSFDDTLTGPFQVLYEESDLKQRYSDRYDDMEVAELRTKEALGVLYG